MNADAEARRADADQGAGSLSCSANQTRLRLRNTARSTHEPVLMNIQTSRNYLHVCICQTSVRSVPVTVFWSWGWNWTSHDICTEHHMTSVLTRTLNLNLTEWVKCVHTVNMIRSDPLRCEAVGRMSSSFFHSVSVYRSIFCLSLILYISLSHSRCVTEGRIQG